MPILTAVASAVVLLVAAAPAAAAPLADHLPVAGLIGSLFSSLGHVVLGAFSWTIGLASKFLLTTLGALVRMLIPRSWATQGVSIMQWIVAVPNYAGTVTGPASHSVYGFGGINALRDLFTWIGVGILPLTLLYGTTRALLGEGGQLAAPFARVLGITALLVSYPYWWTQTAAVTDTLTHSVLALPRVADGLHELMLYAVDGVALGGWQLVDLALMAVVAFELLSLIFLKVVLILLGAVLYATGPITIGLVATEAGASIARAWVSAVVMLVALPVVWATLFAVGALLIGDAGTAGPLIAGHTTVGSLLGGVLLAVAGAASLWMCLRAAREASGLLRLQLGGLLALRHRGSGSPSRAPVTQSSTVQSLRRFGTRIAQAAGGAGAELAGAGPAGAMAMRGARGLAYAGRHGVLGTAAAGGRAATTLAGQRTASLVGRSRAGAVAVRMAKAGTASWHAKPASAPPRAPAVTAAADRQVPGRRDARTAGAAHGTEARRRDPLPAQPTGVTPAQPVPALPTGAPSPARAGITTARPNDGRPTSRPPNRGASERPSTKTPPGGSGRQGSGGER